MSKADGTPSVFDYLDFANVQGYDFHGAGSDNSWEPNRTGHQGNLDGDAQDPYPFTFAVDRAVKAYTDHGGMVWEMSGDTATGTLMGALSGGL